MKINCPNCSHKFLPSEDELYLDYDIDYHNDDRFVCRETATTKHGEKQEIVQKYHGLCMEFISSKTRVQVQNVDNDSSKKHDS